jgi:PAS domain S-box-containing protein
VAKRTTLSREELVERLEALERQLLSQQDIQTVVQELQIHQEEVRVQNAALFETRRDLEVSRDRYAELYDFAPIGLASLDANGVVLSLNLAAARLLGTERQRVFGMPLVFYTVEHGRRRVLDFLARCRRDARPVAPIEIELVGAGGEPIPVELACKGFQANAGSEPVFYTALVDLRERRRADADRLRAAFERERLGSEEAAARLASEAKDRFLAVLSHELRTPLTPVLLTLERLEHDVSDAAATRQALDTIRRNLSIETRLIDDLLDITRIERDRLSIANDTIDVHEAIRHAIEMCGEELDRASLTLRVDLEARHQFVRGDGTRLRQVFWNLLTNATRYTDPGGAIRVKTYDRDGSICVDVADTGRGMDPEDLERVFRPFEQAGLDARRTGLGLGLAICRGLVQAHGGAIRAASTGQGRGTTFTVELPTSAPPQLELRGRALRPATRAGLRILLVEDNEDTAEALATLLGVNGYAVEIAHSLEAARAAAAGAQFDVLLSDLQLPDGSGLDLLRELAARTPVPAIAMSGFGTEQDVQRSREAGFAKHLVKPIAFERVLEAIEDLAGVTPQDAARH